MLENSEKDYMCHSLVVSFLVDGKLKWMQSEENATIMPPSCNKFHSAGLISNGYVTFQRCSLHTFAYNESTELTHPLTQPLKHAYAHLLLQPNAEPTPVCQLPSMTTQQRWGGYLNIYMYVSLQTLFNKQNKLNDSNYLWQVGPVSLSRLLFQFSRFCEDRKHCSWVRGFYITWSISWNQKVKHFDFCLPTVLNNKKYHAQHYLSLSALPSGSTHYYANIKAWHDMTWGESR